MKKLPLLLFCAAIMLLSSCSPSYEPAALNYSANFTAKLNSSSYRGTLSAADNMLTVNLTKPESLRGCTFSFKNGGITVTYDNIKIEAEGGYLPHNSLPKALYNVHKAMGKNDACTLYNSYTEYKGKCESGNYTVQCDLKSGAIQSIKVKTIDLNAELSDVKVNRE